MFNNIIPNIKKSKYSKQNPYRAKNIKLKLRNTYHREPVLRGAENYSHPKLREMQRYGTRSVNSNKIISDIFNDRAIIIEQKDNIIKALVRHSSRYYITVLDTEIQKIKTFLPDNLPNLLEYVQQLIDKESFLNFVA